MRTHEKRICQPEPEKKERKKEEEGADAPVRQYVFEGKVIRLSEDHFNDWKKAYPHIPDLRSELYTRDMWLAEQPEERRKNWFISTSTVLNHKNQKYVAAETLDKKLNPSKYLPRGVGL